MAAINERTVPVNRTIDSSTNVTNVFIGRMQKWRHWRQSNRKMNCLPPIYKRVRFPCFWSVFNPRTDQPSFNQPKLGLTARVLPLCFLCPLGFIPHPHSILEYTQRSRSLLAMLSRHSVGASSHAIWLSRNARPQSSQLAELSLDWS